MALPMASTPTYDVVIPSNGKKVKYRPFLVKEEKALLIAQQSEDIDTMVNTLKSVINSCLDGRVDVEELAIFDLEYLFTQIRSKSVGEVIELMFTCEHCKDPKAKVTIPIDLSSIKVTQDKEHSKKIPLFGDVGVVMKYPSLDTIKLLDDTSLTDVEQVFRMMVDSIDVIYSGEEVFHTKEHTKEETEEFLNNLTQSQFEKIKQFFDTMPRLEHTVEYNCPMCGEHNKTTFGGIQSFF